MGSKWAKNTCLSISNGPGSLLEKCAFHPFSTDFWSQNDPFSRHFGLLRRQKHFTTSSKWAKHTCLSIPNGSRSILENAFLTHFSPNLVPKRPVFKAFWEFPWPKSRHQGLKTGQKHLFEHPKWSRNNFGKKDFFRPGGPGGPRWPPLCAGRAALRLHEVTTGAGV